jgi:polyisoprenoid-binding protein YceI
MTDLAPTAPIRVLNGVELPAPGTWVIDPLHTSLAFEARHAVVTRMRGRFRRSQGRFVIAERPEDSTVEVTIDADSIDTIHPKADEHLRGEGFLDVINFPELTFRSTGVEHVGGDRWVVTGDLTIRGVSRPITLDSTLNGVVEVTYGPRAKFGFTATGSFDRREYGMEMNMPLPGGGVLIGNEVNLTLDVEADLPRDASD